MDGIAFGTELVGIVRDYVDKATAPLLARIGELEKREPVKGEPGKDGVGIVGALVRRNILEIELSDGQIIDAGDVSPIHGKKGDQGDPGKDGETGEKGEPGPAGKDCDMAEVAVMVENAVRKAVEALPAPKEGKAGNDGVGLANALIDNSGALIVTMTDGTICNLGNVNGRDGETFGLDDFDIVPYEDGRTFKFCFTRGEVMHSFEFYFPVPIYRGVYQEGIYEPGDFVTWGGALWHCNRQTQAKPGTDDWTLAVKKGRDGK